MTWRNPMPAAMGDRFTRTQVGRTLAFSVSRMLLLVSVIVTPLAANDPEPKPARSPVDMREFDKFISYDLSRPKSRGSLANLGFEVRTVRGVVRDERGEPVVGALVAMAERIGYSGQCYDENFDKTDQWGRFLLQGDLERERVVIRRSESSIWSVNLESEQEDVVITWPSPAVCHVSVDKSLAEPGVDIFLNSTGYWAGMSVLRVKATLDQNRKAVFKEMLPGDYSISVNKTIEIGDTLERMPIEIGRFSIKSGEERLVQCRNAGRCLVKGRVKANGLRMRLRVTRPKIRYEDSPLPLDFVACDDEGRFETCRLEPGRYLLTFTGPPPNDQGQVRPFGFIARPFTVKHRLEIQSDDERIEINVPVERNDTAFFVQNQLDQDRTGRVAERRALTNALSQHADRDGVVRELLRIMNDPSTPHAWREPALRALATMADSSTIVDAMLARLNAADDMQTKARVIRALELAEFDVGKIIEGVAPYRNDDDMRVRWATYYTLARLNTADSSHQETVVQCFTEMLSDPWDRVRADVAAMLGRLQANEALPALRKTRDDPSAKVRVWGAWAMWKITGDQDPAVRLMTACLFNESLGGKWESAYLLADFEELPPLAVKALLHVTRLDEDPPQDKADEFEQNRIKRTAISTLKKQAPESLEKSGDQG